MLLVATLVVAIGCTAVPREDASTSTTPAEPGRISVYTHCGFHEIEFGGVSWTPESIERGASPHGTGFNATEGVAEVVAGKLIFSADSGLQITFVPTPDDLPPVPGCY